MAITLNGELRQALFIYLADGGERPVGQKLNLIGNLPRADPHSDQLLTQLLIVRGSALRDDKRAYPLAKQLVRRGDHGAILYVFQTHQHRFHFRSGYFLSGAVDLLFYTPLNVQISRLIEPDIVARTVKSLRGKGPRIVLGSEIIARNSIRTAR